MYSVKQLAAIQCAEFVGAMMGAGTACAQQSYPARPLRFIVPYLDAGPNDMFARTLNGPLIADSHVHVWAANFGQFRVLTLLACGITLFGRTPLYTGDGF